MKKGALLIFGILIGVFLIACGGGNSPPKTGAIEWATSHPTSVMVQPTVVQPKVTSTPAVLDISCPPPGTFKRVGKTQQEAVVNYICYPATEGTTYVFKKIDFEQGQQFARIKNTVVDEVNCPDCPHEYNVEGYLSQNFNNDWQVERLNLTETFDSSNNAFQRQKTIEALADQPLLAQVRVSNVGNVTEKTDLSPYYVKVRMTVEWPQGVPDYHRIDLQVETQDGRTGQLMGIEKSSLNGTFVTKPDYEYFHFESYTGQEMLKVLAYQIVLGGAVGDWVRVN